MKAPQERKTPKKIDRINDTGYPNIKMWGNKNKMSISEILQGTNHSVHFRSREQIKTLRDFCNAWLEHDEGDE